MKSIDWKGTIRNLVLAIIVAYTIASVYFVQTKKATFEAYQNSKVESVIIAAGPIEYVTYKLGLNKDLEYKVSFVSTISYATFAVECIKGE